MGRQQEKIDKDRDEESLRRQQAFPCVRARGPELAVAGEGLGVNQARDEDTPDQGFTSVVAMPRFTAESAGQPARGAPVKVNAAAATTRRVTAISIQRYRTSFLKM